MAEAKILVQPIILAAGKGKRILEEAVAAGLGELPKVLYPLHKKPLIDYPIQALTEVAERVNKEPSANWEFLPTIVVVGFRQDLVREHLGNGVIYVDQQEMLGTGHAVRVCEAATGAADAVLVLNGDMPAWQPATIYQLLSCYSAAKPEIALATVDFTDPVFDANFFAYGRIIKDEAGQVERIVEQRDASEEEQAISECNPSLYCFERNFIFAALDKVNNHNSQGEYYLTDVLEIAAKAKDKIELVPAADWREALGVNTIEQLQLAEKLLAARADKTHANN